MNDSRIRITRRTARWDAGDVTVADAMDFWAFAAGAANVIMQMSWPDVGHGVVESKVDSGNLMKHPWKRARTTFQYLAVAILGSVQDRARDPRGGRRCTPARQVHAAKPVAVQRI